MDFVDSSLSYNWAQKFGGSNQRAGTHTTTYQLNLQVGWRGGAHGILTIHLVSNFLLIRFLSIEILKFL